MWSSRAYLHFLETSIGLVAGANQFQTRHFETLAKVIDRTVLMETRRRESEYELKRKIQRERERERGMKRESERRALDYSYNRYAFREAIVPVKGFVATAVDVE